MGCFDNDLDGFTVTGFELGWSVGLKEGLLDNLEVGCFDNDLDGFTVTGFELGWSVGLKEDLLDNL